MSTFGHSIRKQTLDIEVDNEATALALQPRVQDFNRQRLVPLIEQVMDELDDPGLHIRLASLHLDLGSIRLDRWRSETEQRLLSQLRQELGEAVRRARFAPSSEEEARSQQQSRWRLLEHYLLYGTLPFWAASERASFDFEAIFADLAAADGDTLIQLIVRCSKRQTVVERLVAQLTAPTLQQLVALLRPRHADLILAFLDHLRQAHLSRPLMASSRDEVSRLLWLLTLVYLIREPDSQFNRRRYVKSLLSGLASHHGIRYRALLEASSLSLGRDATKRSLDSALMTTIRELLPTGTDLGKAGNDELSSTGAADTPGPDWRHELATAPSFARYDHADILAFYLRHGMLPWAPALADPTLTAQSLVATLPGLPTTQLRWLLPASGVARQRALVRALTVLPENDRARWLERLLPAAARRTGSPLRQAVASFAERAVDRITFYAQVLDALIDSRPLDFEELAAKGTVDLQESAEGPESWSPDRLRAAFLNRLRQPDKDSPGPSVDKLFSSLLDGSAEDTRLLLRALGGVPDLRSRWLRQLPNEQFERSLEVLCPAGAAALLLLQDAWRAIPSPYRPRSLVDVRRALLGEALRLGGGETPSRDTFARLLGGLFASPLAAPVETALKRHLEQRAVTSRLPEPQLAALRRAVEEASQSPEEELANEADIAPWPTVADGHRSLRQAVLSFLLGEAVTPPREQLSTDALRLATRTWLDEAPEELRAFIRRHVKDRRNCRRWSKILPESTLVRLVFLLEPRRHRQLLDAAETLSSAWLEIAPPRLPALTERATFWNFMLEFLSQRTGTQRSVQNLATAWFADRLQHTRTISPGAQNLDQLGSHMVQRADELAHAAGLAGLIAVLGRRSSRLLAAWGADGDAAAASEIPAEEVSTQGLEPSQARPDAARPDAAEPPPRAGHKRNRSPRSGSDGGGTEPDDPIYIENAGLVLAGAFLPRFFGSLDLLNRNEDGTVVLPPSQASRGVHLLQYLVNGRGDTPEPELAFNKLLCGMPFTAAVDRAIEPTAHEIEICDQLLRSMLANWTVIQNTSIAGLRETFLQRQGRLHRSPEGWQLRVQRKTLDVLVDQVPWSLSVVYHNWMPEPIHVTW